MVKTGTRAKPDKKVVRVTEKKNKKNETSAEQFKIIQRQTWATDLRRQGLSYRRIARRMIELKLVPKTYAEGLAYLDVRTAMGRVLAEQREIAEENLYIDLQRYDQLFEKAWALALPKSEEGEVEMPPDPVYFSVVMGIMEKRAQLLNYKSLWAEKDKANFNINVDWSTFSTAEILEIRQRIASGEEPIIVITEVQQKRPGATPPPA